MSSVIPTQEKIDLFKRTIWDFYHAYGREFPWRRVTDPYPVVVSEVMLQQTQTFRVLEKFELFMAEFPTFSALANASLLNVLSVWQGLGYNRRGKFLHQLAKKVVEECSGQLPDDPALLQTLPGIGKATAASIAAFAFNKPTVFIETNIRTVFIHFFFSDAGEKIADATIMPLVAKTVDHDNPREWYYALMDYGVMLKRTQVNPSRRSAHYTKQSKFEGSDRQVRGRIIKLLTERKELTLDELKLLIADKKGREERVIAQLIKEQLIAARDDLLFI